MFSKLAGLFLLVALAAWCLVSWVTLYPLGLLLERLMRPPASSLQPPA